MWSAAEAWRCICPNATQHCDLTESVQTVCLEVKAHQSNHILETHSNIRCHGFVTESVKAQRAITLQCLLDNCLFGGERMLVSEYGTKASAVAYLAA